MEAKTIEFTLFGADCRGNPKNTFYPHKYVIHSLDDFLKMADRDFVCARYRNGHRDSDDFVSADCVAMDCDNTHSDNPEDWKTPDDIKAAFPNVPFVIHFSRNHMKEKKGKAPRPKFHVIFPIEPVTDSDAYKLIKEKLITLFPQFDPNALDSARFMYGTKNPQGVAFFGEGNLEDIIRDVVPNYRERNDKATVSNGTASDIPEEIPEGQRNKTMHEYALSVLTRLSDTSRAYMSFLEVSKRCSPPLDESELLSIWTSALNYYNRNIKTQTGYMDPVQYGLVSDFGFIDSKKDIFTLKEFLESNEHDSWLIKDFVYKGPHLQYLFGESGSGKSFVAIDMGLSIAYGLEMWFFDKRISHGKVIYFCGEGINGVRKRIRAWKLFHNIEADSADFCIYTNNWMKLNHEGTIQVISDKLRTQIEGGFIPDLVIIDTQARFTEGDENKQVDADSYINAFNALANVFNSNVLVVHHTSKGNGETLKGSVNFKGASDLDVQISKFGSQGVKISHEKNKDGEELKNQILRFEKVNLDMTENGDIISSLVLTDKNLSDLPPVSDSERVQITEDLVLMRDFWDGNARHEGENWVFNRSSCIEYLESDCGWTHKKAVQETHVPNKGLFARLKKQRIILQPEPVGDTPAKGKNAKPQDYIWRICEEEASNLGLLGN